MTAMLLKIMGCRNVILTGHKDEKLKKAQEISRCDYVINSNKMEKEERFRYIREITDGGPDLVIPCVHRRIRVGEKIGNLCGGGSSLWIR